MLLELPQASPTTQPWSLGLPHTHARDAIASQGQGLGERGVVRTDSGPGEFISVLGTILLTLVLCSVVTSRLWPGAVFRKDSGKGCRAGR